MNPACETVAKRKLSDPKSLVEFKQNSRSETCPLYFLAILISLRIRFLYIFIEVFFCVMYPQVLWRDLFMAHLRCIGMGPELYRQQDWHNRK